MVTIKVNCSYTLQRALLTIASPFASESDSETGLHLSNTATTDVHSNVYTNRVIEVPFADVRTT